MRFELHCHSTCSDGSEPPERVAARAAERGVAVFALTDHDTCAGTGVPVTGARSIRAVELSCCDDQKRTIHVLAYDRGGDWEHLASRLGAIREARTNRVKVMATKLEMRGIKLDITKLLDEARSRSIGRPDLAKLMVAGGHASSIKDAFSRHLYDQGPVDVPHNALQLADAITLGREAGAALSLAHPHLYDERSAAMLRTYKAAGLEGIEAFHGGYDARERSRWLAVADQLGLVCTGGSDWHGPEEAQGQIGVDLPDDRSEALLRWLG
ncbi:MAG: PHP domain-containing protein [Deltaproteobacteria bacterium]|nr:PHP domain-containing protein [Deltaproteobacteria bacterium]